MKAICDYFSGSASKGFPPPQASGVRSTIGSLSAVTEPDNHKGIRIDGTICRVVLDPLAILLSGLGGWEGGHLRGLLFNRIPNAIPAANEVVAVLVMELDTAAGAEYRVAGDVAAAVVDDMVLHEVQVLVVAALRVAERAIPKRRTRLSRAHAVCSRSSVRFVGVGRALDSFDTPGERAFISARSGWL